MAASDWDSISNKPSVFAPANHKHTAIYRTDSSIAYVTYLNANKETLGWGLQFADVEGSCAYMYLTSATKNTAPTITVYAPDGATSDTVLMTNAPISQTLTLGAASKTRTKINQTIQFGAWEIVRDSFTIGDNVDWNSTLQNINTFQTNYVAISNSTTVTNFPTGAYSYGQCLTSAWSYGPNAQIYIPHSGSSGNGIWYRSGWSTDIKAWANILDTSNYTKYVYTRDQIDNTLKSYYGTYDRAANTVLAAPNGSNGVATFRKLVSADLPNVLPSLGNQTPELNRVSRGGLYTYNGYNADNTPYSYLSIIGFGNGIKGQAEMAAQWNGSATGLWIRALRDVTDNWYDWNRVWVNGNSVTGAVWNDYAEYRQCNDKEPGYVVLEDNTGYCNKTSYRLSPFAGVISDTWGFSQGETETATTNIAVAGRVLVYTSRDRNQYKIGDCVCADKNGTVDIMSRKEIITYPDRIVGTVSEIPTYEEWGGGKNADRPPIKVNKRIWIKVK